MTISIQERILIDCGSWCITCGNYGTITFIRDNNSLRVVVKAETYAHANIILADNWNNIPSNAMIEIRLPS